MEEEEEEAVVATGKGVPEEGRSTTVVAIGVAVGAEQRGRQAWLYAMDEEDGCRIRRRMWTVVLANSVVMGWAFISRVLWI